MPITMPGSVWSFRTSVALDAVRNTNGNAYSAVHKRAQRDNHPAAFELVSGLGAPVVFQQAPEAMVVRSNGPADGAGNIGARSVTIFGIDENGDFASESVDLVAQDISAPTTTTFLRVFEAQVDEVGFYGVFNGGPLEVENTSGTQYMRILARQGRTLHGSISVPRAHSFILEELSLGFSSGQFDPVVSFNLWSRGRFDDDTTNIAPQILERQITLNGPQVVDVNLETPLRFDEYTDLWIDAACNPAGGNLFASLTGFFVPNR